MAFQGIKRKEEECWPESMAQMKQRITSWEAKENLEVV